MFKEMADHRLIDDDGVEVFREDRNVMRYRDGDHVLTLYCDPIADGHGRFGAAIVLPRDPHWEPPFDQEPIEDAMRQVIAENIVDAWRVVDYWVKIEAGA